MSLANITRLFTLAAIWGGSFLLMRIAAPVMAPGLLIAGRVLTAALFLVAVAALLKKGSLNLRVHWRHYFVLGLFGSAMPFYFFAFASQSLPASLLSILNATSPIWGAIIGVVWMRQPLSRKSSLGLILGIVGVALLVGLDPAALNSGALPILAALSASFCYGIVTNYTKSALVKRFAGTMTPFDNAHGSMWAAAVLIVPLASAGTAPVYPGLGPTAAVIALGVICSGVAYLLYFRLIDEIGAVSALTVTFLIPLFGVLFGHVFLDEAVGWHTLVGSAIVILGTALVTDFNPQTLFSRSAP